MPFFWSRPYRGIKDLHLLIKFAADAAGARLPHSTYMKPGDIVWGMPASRFDQQPDIRLWFDGAEVAAYGWFEAPLHVDFDIKPGLGRYDLIGDEILEWAEDCRESRPPSESIPKAYAMLGAGTVSAIALRSDRRRIALLENRGYERTDRFSVFYAQSLDGLIAARPPGPGLRLRHATDDDLEERVDVHRDAWSVWGPSAATVETYSRLRAAPVYDAELDVVLEDVEGRFLSYCIGWLDRANGAGHFEPVGCRPAFTRRGYARAVIFEALRRMQARGMRRALVNTESVNEPARQLYLSCGFMEIDRADFYVKRILGTQSD